MLADRVRRGRREVQRASSVSEDEFAQLLGQSNGQVTRTRAGVAVGKRQVLGLTAWYRGVYALSTGVGFLPVHAFRTDANGERSQRVDPLWFRPDVDQTLARLFAFMVMSLLHDGNSYTWKMRGPTGQVTGLRQINPKRVTGGLAPDGSKRFLVDQDPREYTTYDILHIPWMDSDGAGFGLNPIATLAEALGIVAAADQYAQRFFGNNTHVGGIISVGAALDETAAKRLRAEWEAFHEGLLNAHKTGVLSQGSTYQRLSLNAAETQLLETRTFGIDEVSRALSIPPPMLYELSHATFSNIEQQAIQYVQDGLQPIVERLEDAIYNDPHLLPPGNYVEFNLEGRQRGDLATRYSAIATAVGRPWRTPNEARKLDNLPPLPGGDELLMPLNMGQAATHGTDALGGDPDATPDN